MVKELSTHYSGPIPLLTNTCSISAQRVDSGGNAVTFSVHGGNYGGFSSNVLRYMPVSKIAGRYLMVFNPERREIIIKVLRG